MRCLIVYISSIRRRNSKKLANKIIGVRVQLECNGKTKGKYAEMVLVCGKNVREYIVQMWMIPDGKKDHRKDGRME